MVVCRHFVRCFVGQFNHKDVFGYFCGGQVVIFVSGFYDCRFRVGGIVYRVHRPHIFPQFIHLIFRQNRNRGALFAARHIRRKDRQGILPADVVYIIVGCNVLAVMLYRIGDSFQPVAVFYRLLYGNSICAWRSC